MKANPDVPGVTTEGKGRCKQAKGREVRYVWYLLTLPNNAIASNNNSDDGDVGGDGNIFNTCWG